MHPIFSYFFRQHYLHQVVRVSFQPRFTSEHPYKFSVPKMKNKMRNQNLIYEQNQPPVTHLQLGEKKIFVSGRSVRMRA